MTLAQDAVHIGDRVCVITTDLATRGYAPDSVRSLCRPYKVLAVGEEGRLDLIGEAGRMTLRHSPKALVVPSSNPPRNLRGCLRTWHSAEEHKRNSGRFHLIQPGEGMEELPTTL
jgi:hypothetical protein